MKDPNDLWGHDNQAFAVVREYLHAHRTTQEHKKKSIRDANQDLTGYFDFVEYSLRKNPYYAM